MGPGLQLGLPARHQRERRLQRHQLRLQPLHRYRVQVHRVERERGVRPAARLLLLGRLPHRRPHPPGQELLLAARPALSVQRGGRRCGLMTTRWSCNDPGTNQAPSIWPRPVLEPRLPGLCSPTRSRRSLLVGPTSLPLSGGPVLISGSGFTPSTTVTFGSAPASAVTVLSDNYLLATAPPGGGQGRGPR